MYGMLFYILSVLTVTFTSSLSSSVSLTSDKGCYENAGTAELTAKYSGKSTVRNVTWHYQTDECSCSLAASSCLVAKYSGNCSGDGVDGGFPIKRIKFHCNNVTQEYKITINNLQLAVASGGTKWGVAFTLEDGNISEFVYQILNECVKDSTSFPITTIVAITAGAIVLIIFIFCCWCCCRANKRGCRFNFYQKM